MKFKMIDQNVLVEPITEQVSESGLVIKTDFEPITMKGKVIAVSDEPDCSELAVGDTVYFHKFAGKNNQVKDGDKTYRIMNFADIVAKEV